MYWAQAPTWYAFNLETDEEDWGWMRIADGKVVACSWGPGLKSNYSLNRKDVIRDRYYCKNINWHLEKGKTEKIYFVNPVNIRQWPTSADCTVYMFLYRRSAQLCAQYSKSIQILYSYLTYKYCSSLLTWSLFQDSLKKAHHTFSQSES